MLIEEDLVDLPGDSQLGLELPDAPFRGRQLDRLVGAEAVELPAVDALLFAPAIDRRIADRERRSELLTRVPA
jgi:hypothetical protein